MKKHYSWAVLAACCALMAGLGLTSNCVGQYFVPVTNDMGFGLGQFTLYYTLRGVFLVITMPFLSKLLEKVETRLLLSTCFAVQVLCTALMGTFTKIWQWYIAGAVMGTFLAPVYLVVPPIILSNWFAKKTGAVVGIALAFSGIGGAIMNPLLASLIQSFGWRTAYIANGIIAGVVVLPFLMFVIRLKPADKGLKPYGYEEDTDKALRNPSEGALPAAPEAEGVSRNVAVRSVSFYIMIALGALCGVFSGYPQLISAYGISIGYNATFAAFLLSLGMIGNVISKLLMGYLKDKFGGKVMMNTALVVNLASLVFLLGGVRFLPSLLAGSFLSGTFLTVTSVAMPLLIHSIYGARDYSRIFMLLALSQNIISSVSPTLVGYMIDRSGGYSLPYTVGLIVAVAAFCLTFFAHKTSRNLTRS